jgi:hypothetical protein
MPLIHETYDSLPCKSILRVPQESDEHHARDAEESTG